jgi:hypothetical protein
MRSFTIEVDAIDAALVASLFVLVFIIGGAIATAMWFRWYLDDSPLDAIEQYANREW